MSEHRVSSGPEGTRQELVLSGLVKAYGGVVALRGVDLVARTGEVHGLIGENGAGKSTLVKILSGAVSPDAGEITLAGAPLTLGVRRPLAQPASPPRSRS